MRDINDDEETYVCITHQSICPCEEGENHLISNWAVDVKKIIQMIERKNGLA